MRCQHCSEVLMSHCLTFSSGADLERTTVIYLSMIHAVLDREGVYYFDLLRPESTSQPYMKGCRPVFVWDTVSFMMYVVCSQAHSWEKTRIELADRIQ
jgi:hypothetical protein